MKKVSLYPADVYQVIDKSLLSETDKLILNMLYMPIIGSIAVALYLKMQSETWINSSSLNDKYGYNSW